MVKTIPSLPDVAFPYTSRSKFLPAIQVLYSQILFALMTTAVYSSK